ncbi:MAG: hypothetical protein LVO36_00260 [Nitrosopumilus sp. (ex Thoosa mismalolli)]|nr:hypothetical protein [Nitrosopumilus sp. (ex Thoosa mismalolli)]
MSQRPFRKFNQKRKPLSTEQKIEKFILRNSDNGYFTKISTISKKFEISDDRTWGVIGELLIDGKIESTHDEFSGEMKLCRTGKIYLILNSEQNRKRRSRKKFQKKSKSKKSKEEDIMPSQCHPVIKSKEE